MLSDSVVPVDGVVSGTVEHWQACENPITTCEEYKGVLYGLCKAYCNAMECAGDEPNASEEDCQDVRGNFFKMGGEVLPCFNHFVGDFDRMFCYRNGIVLSDSWGTGTWNGEPGYSFAVVVQDFGKAGQDLYQIYVWAPDGALEHYAGDFLSSGNLVVLP